MKRRSLALGTGATLSSESAVVDAMFTFERTDSGARGALQKHNAKSADLRRTMLRALRSSPRPPREQFRPRLKP